MNKTLFLIVSACLFLLTASLASTATIESIQAESFSPGSEGSIRIEIRNNLDKDLERLSISLLLSGVPFIPIGTSEQSLSELDEDDKESFFFTIKASPNIIAGDYEIPYTIQYLEVGSSELKFRNGSLGVRVIANPILSYSVSAENPIVGRQGRINIRIINKGFYDARFVSLTILPEEFTVLSEREVYIGSVDSDDFETASFETRFTKENPSVNFIVEYIDFNNVKKVEHISLPVSVYSEKKALEIGLTEKSNISFYIFSILFIIILILIWRFIKRRKRLNRRRRLE